VRTALKGLLGLVVVLLALAGVGAVAGVGPMAGATPARDVTDPREMVARSLQAVIDTNAVHLDMEVAGTLPGAVFGLPDATVDLAGTVAGIDILPKDAKTRLHVEVPAAEINLDSVNSWDALWYRTAPGGEWTRGSIGSVASTIGFDANPLTLVDRLRSWLATSGAVLSSIDAPCGSASGTCREVTIDAGTGPGTLFGEVTTAVSGTGLPATYTTVTLLSDVETLRPYSLTVDIVSDDGTADMRILLEASGWDVKPSIEEPVAGS
jgi:hypothetical protein